MTHALHLPAWVGPVAHYMFHVGLVQTLKIAFFAVAGSAAIGIVLGTLLTLRVLAVRAAIRLYIEVWRGLPIIVTIFLIYFGLPSLQIRLTAFNAAWIGLTLWGSAQIAEATRGAIQSVPREQHEAAAALGLGWLGTMRNVIQNTTIAALIGVAEVLQAGQRSVERLQLTPPSDSHAFAIYGGVMAMFFVISFPLTRLAALLERRLV